MAETGVYCRLASRWNWRIMSPRSNLCWPNLPTCIQRALSRNLIASPAVLTLFRCCAVWMFRYVEVLFHCITWTFRICDVQPFNRPAYFVWLLWNQHVFASFWSNQFNVATTNGLIFIGVIHLFLFIVGCKVLSVGVSRDCSAASSDCSGSYAMMLTDCSAVVLSSDCSEAATADFSTMLMSSLVGTCSELWHCAGNWRNCDLLVSLWPP